MFPRSRAQTALRDLGCSPTPGSVPGHGRKYLSPVPHRVSTVARVRLAQGGSNFLTATPLPGSRREFGVFGPVLQQSKGRVFGAMTEKQTKTSRPVPVY